MRAYADALGSAGIAHTVLDAGGASSGGGVRLATMHRVKGLEFTHVRMYVPAAAMSAQDPRDQSLLYVAATRCRRTLTVLREASA